MRASVISRVHAARMISFADHSKVISCKDHAPWTRSSACLNRPKNASIASWYGFDLAQLEEELKGLEEASLATDFWSDQASAQKTMRRIRVLQDDVALWKGLQGKVSELLELSEMVDPSEDAELMQEIESDSKTLVLDLDSAESALMLDGPYDANDALLSIHAGAGGTESQDWTQMLMRLYTRWAERQGFKVEIVDRTAGEEAGIKSVSMTLSGHNAYGMMLSERGVHRLVRISPFDASSRRHTSFALVEASPVIDDDIEIELNESDIDVDTYRASGAGGQHVNKTDSAVRMTHRPSGIVVQCQNERSQGQNREIAMRMLRAKLLEQKLAEREAEQLELRGQHVEAGWGNQIRSYVLHPYQMVKDHRTKTESGKTQAVLDGEINDFIEAYLRWRIGSDAGS